MYSLLQIICSFLCGIMVTLIALCFVRLKQELNNRNATGIKAQVIDWLKQIVDEPEQWQTWYSDSEVKGLAECALEMLYTDDCW